MTVDEIHAILDKDPEVTATVDETLANLRQAKIINLGYYKYLVMTYKGWKPLPYEEYQALLRGDSYTTTKLERAQARFEHNEKVKRQFRLTTRKKD